MDLKWLTLFVAASTLSLVPVAEASLTVHDYAKFYQDNQDWEYLRRAMETVPRYSASEVIFSQNSQPPFSPQGTNLLHLYLYNLAIKGCRVEIPVSYNKDQLTKTQIVVLADIVHKNPACFSSGDTVIFAAAMEASNGIVNPLLYPAAIIIDILGNGRGLVLQSLSFAHDVPILEAVPGFFQRSTVLHNTPIPFTSECKPSDLSTYQTVAGAVSNFQFRQMQGKYVGVQLNIIPDREGCSSTKPINIIGDYNPGAPSAFPNNCYGTVYATKIFRQMNSFIETIPMLTCGDAILYKFKLDPTEGTTVVFSAESASYVKETIDCGSEVSKATKDPAIPAKHVHIKRNRKNDLSRSAIDYILFESESGDCAYRWYDAFEDGSDHVIGVETLFANPCFAKNPVAMKVYYKHICRTHPNILPLPKLQFTTSNITNHEVFIDLRSNETRTHFSSVVYDLDRCQSNEKSQNDTVVDVNAIAFARDSLKILDTKVTRIQLYRDENCAPVITLRDGSAGSIETPDLNRFVDLKHLSPTCLGYGDTVSLRYAYDEICVDSWFWIPGSVRLVDNNAARTWKVHFPGNTPETRLGVYTELINNTCVPEYVVPHMFTNSADTPPVPVSVSYITFENVLNSPDDRRVMYVEFVSLNEKQSCWYQWSGPFQHNTTRHLRVQDILESKSCFADTTEVRARVVYYGMCHNEYSEIPITLEIRKSNGANGLLISLDGESSTNTFRVVSEVYDRCEIIPLQKDIPHFEAGSVAIERDIGDIFETKISQIRFFRDASCHGLWTMTSGDAGTVEKISSDAIIQSAGCLNSGDTVYLQYKYASVCQANWFWMQVSLNLGGYNKLTIHPTGTSVEDHLLALFKLTKPPPFRALRASKGNY